jgi:hypothetical protein
MPMSARLVALAACVALVGACNPTVPPFTPDVQHFDGGPRDAAAMDASRRDANVDAGPPEDTNSDSGIDAFNGRDANFDAGDLRAFDSWIGEDAFSDDANRDAGPPPDTSGCHLPDGAFDVCNCSVRGADCSVNPCASGQVCITDACGMQCIASGAACAGPSDCPAASTCDASGFCLHGGTGCTDSRDCANGFACEASVCVDRRIPCDSAGGCPFGFECDGTDACVRQSRPCGTSFGCGSLACVDVNGDGRTECNFAGTCVTNADCPTAGQVCAPRAEERFASCGRYGPCASVADCASGMLCVDLWGDGVPECVDSGGSCANSAACPVGSVCATPATGGPPSCLTSG